MGLRARGPSWLAIGWTAVAVAGAAIPELVSAEEPVASLVQGKGATEEAAEQDAVTKAIVTALELAIGKDAFAAKRAEIDAAVANRRDALVLGVSRLSARKDGDGFVAVVRVELSPGELGRIAEQFGAAPAPAVDDDPAVPRRVRFPKLPAALDSAGDSLTKHTDDRIDDPLLRMSDLRTVELSRDGRDLVLDFTVGAPWKEGIFAVGKLSLDADANPKTGDPLGLELQVHSAVGSRFRPHWFAPEPGLPAPISLLRTGASTPGSRGLDGARKTSSLVWSDVLEPPKLWESGLRARVPDSLIRKYADRYGGGFAFEFLLETGCEEHALVFDYVAIGDGLPIKVDGKGDEWSGGPRVEDAVDELHSEFGHLDVAEVWADHDKDHVYLRVDFAEPGLRETPTAETDVRVEDAVIVDLIPLGRRYMEPRRIIIYSAAHRSSQGGAENAVQGRTLELGIPRNENQSHFQIAVRSEARRIDVLGTGRIEVEPR